MNTDTINNFYSHLFKALLPSKKEAYRYYNESFNYAELNQVMRRVNYLLNGLQNRPVIIYSNKSLEAYGAIFACILSGNIWVPASPDMPTLRNNKIIDMVDPGIVLIDTDLPGEILSHLQSKNVNIIDLRKFTE